MITIEEACEIALKEFKHMWGENWGIRRAYSFKDLWIISPCDKSNPKEIFYDQGPIAVNKNSGEIIPYEVHEHFEEFEKAKKIRIPKEYR